MFDVRSILDELLRGGARAQQQRSPSRSEKLSDWPGQVAPADRSVEGQAVPPSSPFPSGGAGERPANAPLEGTSAPSGTAALPAATSLEDLLRSVLGNGDAPEQKGVGGAAGGGLGDLLEKLRQQTSQGRGGIFDVLGQVLGQAAAGVREGADRADMATGASKHSREAIEQMTGKTPEQILAQLKALIADNQIGAGAALGGLGALILGTQAGRSLAATAAKLGGLALIGGLAYKAYQNYQQGQAPATGAGPSDRQQTLLVAPEGSGFEPGALSNNGASLLIRTMIAAAAADGRMDASERQNILGNLRQAGAPAEAQRFLMQEVQRPAAPADLAREVSSREQAVQVYTAARIAVDVDSEEEHAFLTTLAERLGIERQLAAHIDAAARRT